MKLWHGFTHNYCIPVWVGKIIYDNLLEKSMPLAFSGIMRHILAFSEKILTDINLVKAFDLVDHTLLLKKLRHYKLSDKTINWFSSYLLGRKQKVVINFSMPIHVLQYVIHAQKRSCTHLSFGTYVQKRRVIFVHA